jgi:hypothetical protein
LFVCLCVCCYNNFCFRFLTRRVLAGHFSVPPNAGLEAINQEFQVPMHQSMQ